MVAVWGTPLGGGGRLVRFSQPAENKKEIGATTFTKVIFTRHDAYLSLARMLSTSISVNTTFAMFCVDLPCSSLFMVLILS